MATPCELRIEKRVISMFEEFLRRTGITLDERSMVSLNKNYALPLSLIQSHPELPWNHNFIGLVISERKRHECDCTGGFMSGCTREYNYRRVSQLMHEDPRFDIVPRPNHTPPSPPPCLSRSRIATWDEVLAHPEVKWDYADMTSNPNMYPEIIATNPDLGWNYDEMSTKKWVNVDLLIATKHKDWNYAKLFSMRHLVREMVKRGIPVRDIVPGPIFKKMNLKTRNLVFKHFGDKCVKSEKQQANMSPCARQNMARISYTILPIDALSGNPAITYKYIINNPDVRWNRVPMRANEKVPLEFIFAGEDLRAYPDMSPVARRKDITEEFIRKHLSVPWKNDDWVLLMKIFGYTPKMLIKEISGMLGLGMSMYQPCCEGVAEGGQVWSGVVFNMCAARPVLSSDVIHKSFPMINRHFGLSLRGMNSVRVSCQSSWYAYIDDLDGDDPDNSDYRDYLNRWLMYNPGVTTYTEDVKSCKYRDRIEVLSNMNIFQWRLAAEQEKMYIFLVKKQLLYELAKIVWEYIPH